LDEKELAALSQQQEPNSSPSSITDDTGTRAITTLCLLKRRCPGTGVFTLYKTIILIPHPSYDSVLISPDGFCGRQWHEMEEIGDDVDDK
jgi:hypothetical protein